MDKPTTRMRGRPTAQRAAALDDLLIETALQEFIAHGYGAASLSRIVRKASISKTTLYTRYPSKQELFRAVIRAQVDQAGAEAALRSIRDSENIREGLKSFASAMLSHSLGGRPLEVNRLIVSEARRFPELGIMSEENTESGIRRVCSYLEDAIGPDRSFRVEPRILAEAFIHHLRSWYLSKLLTAEPVQVEEREALVQRAVKVVLAGIDG